MCGDGVKITQSLFQEKESGVLPTSPLQFIVKQIGKIDGYNYFRENHYSKSCSPNIFPVYGLFFDNKMYGAIGFHIPTSENLRISILGEKEKQNVLEIHRMYVSDEAPRNTESRFIAIAIKLLKKKIPTIKALVTFADSTEGHTGIIYKATGFEYRGMTGKSTFYKDESGRLRYPRQAVWINGKRVRKNLTREEAFERGWTVEKRSGKYRFVKIIT